jgi:hypothetical protein
MAPITTLSIREENELCVAIAAELADYVQDGSVSHAFIRQSLKNCVAIYGVGHCDDFFIEMTLKRIESWMRWR